MDALKVEILERPNTFPKPLIAIVKGVTSKHEFDESQLDALSLEVVGGNHRREALTQLIKEGKLDITYTMTQLYTGILLFQLRLASTIARQMCHMCNKSMIGVVKEISQYVNALYS